MNVTIGVLFRILAALDAPKSNTQIMCAGRLTGPGMSGSAELLGAPSYLCCSNEDVAMNTPGLLSVGGFDRIFNLLENAAGPQNGDNWAAL